MNREVACREVATDARCVSLCLHAACRRKLQRLRALRASGTVAEWPGSGGTSRQKPWRTGYLSRRIARKHGKQGNGGRNVPARRVAARPGDRHALSALAPAGDATLPRVRGPVIAPSPMKIYDSFGPNPRALRMFLLEKGIEVPKVEVDLLGMENRRPPYTDHNPGRAAAGAPARRRARHRRDGRDLRVPRRALPEAPARRLHRRGARRDALLAAARRAAHHRAPLQRLPLRRGSSSSSGRASGCSPRRPTGLKATVQDNLAWLDPLMAGKQWIVGPRFTMADIILYAALDFGRGVGQPVRRGACERERVVRAGGRASERGREPAPDVRGARLGGVTPPGG